MVWSEQNGDEQSGLRADSPVEAFPAGLGLIDVHLADVEESAAGNSASRRSEGNCEWRMGCEARVRTGGRGCGYTRRAAFRRVQTNLEASAKQARAVDCTTKI